MSFTMPNCASAEGWAQCSLSRMDDPMSQGNCSSDCIECEQLTEECAGYSGAGYGNCVPKSCVNFCCKDGMPKIPDEVKSALNMLAKLILQQLKLTNDQLCQVKNFGSDLELLKLIIQVLFELHMKGKINLDKMDPNNLPPPPPELIEAMKQQLILNAQKGNPCFEYKNGQCLQGKFTNVQSKDINKIGCNTNVSRAAADVPENKPFYKKPLGITLIALSSVLVLLLIVVMLRNMSK